MRTIDTTYNPQPNVEGMMHLRIFEGMPELVDLGGQIDQRYTGTPEAANLASLCTTAEFAGSVSMAETVRLGRYGWPEGTARLAEVVDKLDVEALQATIPLPEPHYDVYGEEPDVARFLEGDPESMVNWDTMAMPGSKKVEFVINAGFSHLIPFTQVIDRGAAIVAATKALEARGYSVGITAAFPAQSHIAARPQRGLCYYVPLAEAGQYLDVDAVAFGLAHASVFRRLIFSAMEQEPAPIRHAFGISPSGAYGVVDTIRFAPYTDCFTIFREGGFGMDTFESAQSLVDAATGRVELPTGKFERFTM